MKNGTLTSYSLQTEAAVLSRLTQPLSLMTLSIPELKPGQLLVKVSYSGICHTQLSEIRGNRGPDPFLPHTLGHEGSGTVLAVGSGVTKVKTGDTVVISWIKGSGADVPSTNYGSSEGTVNSGAVSTFMRQTVTCENRVTVIDPQMPLREAALLGCAFPTGAGMVFHTAKIVPGNSVAVFGVGGIGLSAVLAASRIRDTTVIAVDIIDHKLEQARMVGATHVIHAEKQNTLERIRELTQGVGVDCAIEAAGSKETMETAFASVHNRGGLCVIAGNLKHGEKFAMDPFDLIQGKKIVGTWGGETEPDVDIPRYVDLYRSGKLPLEKLITREYPLKEINQAFNDLEKGKLGRALIQMNEMEG